MFLMWCLIFGGNQSKEDPLLTVHKEGSPSNTVGTCEMSHQTPAKPKHWV